MKPQKAHRLICQAFKKGNFTKLNNESLDGLSFFKTPNVKSAIKKLLEKAKLYENITTPVSYYDPGARPETLYYISDRFNCVGRLQYLWEIVNAQ